MPFCEDAPRAVRVITVELPDVQRQDDLHVLNRQIPDRAFIAAMDTMSGSTTHRTDGGTRHSFTGEDQALGLSAGRKQTETTQMRKKGMERQEKTPWENRCIYACIFLFYHISSLHQTGRRTRK